MFRTILSVTLLLLAGPLSLPQKAPEAKPSPFVAVPPQILRATRIKATGVFITQTCLAAYSDGRLRMERTKLDISHFHPTSKVYEKSLSTAEMNNLTGILGSEDFRKLRTPSDIPPFANQDWETWIISVARDENPQNLVFESGDRTTSRPPKAFVDWFNAVDRQKLAELPDAEAGQCSLHMSPGEFRR